MPTTKIQCQGSERTKSPFCPWLALWDCPTTMTQDLVSAQPSAISPCPSNAVGVLVSLSLSPSQPCLAWTLWVWTHFLACPQTCLCQYRPAQQSRDCVWPWLFSPDLMLSQTRGSLPSFSLDLPYCCELAWRCSLMAETGCFLQACPAPLAGVLAGEVPVPGAVLLH